MRRLSVLLVLLLLPLPANAQDDTRRDVLSTIRSFFDAFAARDVDGMLAAVDPDGRLVVTGSDPAGAPTVQAYGLGEFAQIIASRQGPPLVETYRNPRVTIHDNLASVWLDYDLWAGGVIDHCGEDLFQLARTTQGWKITAIADTQRRDCVAPTPEPGPSALRAIYEQGVPFGRFVDEADQRKDRWQANMAASSVPSELADRASTVNGTWHVIVVAEDWCSDSSDTIPHVARLVDSVPGADLRIVSSGPGREIMEAFRTPDGRASTPTVVVTNEAFEIVGCFIERPEALQTWAVANRASLTEAEFVRRKTAWYEWDHGHQTMAQVLSIFERAATGTKGCNP